jgi:uncharacterized protein YcfJ
VNDISDKVVGYDVRYSMAAEKCGWTRSGNWPVDKEGKLILSQNEESR